MHRDLELDTFSIPYMIEQILRGTPLPTPLVTLQERIQSRFGRWCEDGELSKSLHRMRASGCVEAVLVDRVLKTGRLKVMGYRFIERRDGKERRRRAPMLGRSDRRATH